MNLKNDIVLEPTINDITSSFLYDDSNLFYINKQKSLQELKITYINYSKYNNTTYDEKIDFLNIFHTVYKNTFKHLLFNPKLIIIIDVNMLKKQIELSNENMYNISLINLIRHISDNYDDYIEKCLIINYNNIEKGLITLFKLLLKNINFVNKINVYEKKS
jgi:hypothetical protein